MTKEQELLKEAAEMLSAIRHQKDANLSYDNFWKSDEVEKKLLAFLSQPLPEPVTALSWEQAKYKIAREKGFNDWDHVVAKCDRMGNVDYFSERVEAAAHLFMEANRVSRWIPVEERLPDDNQKILFVFNNQVVAGIYMTIFGKAEFVCSAVCCKNVTLWMPLPVVPEVTKK